MTSPLNIVWFKRDLRIVDHQPLARALEAGPVLPIYIVEPKLWAQPDVSERQWATLKFKAQKRGSAKLAKIVRVSLAKIALCGYVKGNWARNRWGKVAR